MATFKNIHATGITQFMSETNPGLSLMTIDGKYTNDITVENMEFLGSLRSNVSSIFTGVSSFRDNDNTPVLSVDPANSSIASTNLNVQSKLLVNDLNVQTSKVLFNSLNTSSATAQATSIICNCIVDATKESYAGMTYDNTYAEADSFKLLVGTGSRTPNTTALVTNDYVIVNNPNNASDINNGIYVFSASDNGSYIILKKAGAKVSEVEKLDFIPLTGSPSPTYDVYCVYVHHMLFKEADSIKYGYNNNASNMLDGYYDLIQSSGSYEEIPGSTGAVAITKSVTEFTATPQFTGTITLPDPVNNKSYTFKVINSTSDTISVTMPILDPLGSETAVIPSGAAMSFTSSKNKWFGL